MIISQLPTGELKERLLNFKTDAGLLLRGESDQEQMNVFNRTFDFILRRFDTLEVKRFENALDDYLLTEKKSRYLTPALIGEMLSLQLSEQKRSAFNRSSDKVYVAHSDDENKKARAWFIDQAYVNYLHIKQGREHENIVIPYLLERAYLDIAHLLPEYILQKKYSASQAKDRLKEIGYGVARKQNHMKGFVLNGGKDPDSWSCVARMVDLFDLADIEGVLPESINKLGHNLMVAIQRAESDKSIIFN